MTGPWERLTFGEGRRNEQRVGQILWHMPEYPRAWAAPQYRLY